LHTFHPPVERSGISPVTISMPPTSPSIKACQYFLITCVFLRDRMAEVRPAGRSGRRPEMRNACVLPPIAAAHEDLAEQSCQALLTEPDHESGWNGPAGATAAELALPDPGRSGGGARMLLAVADMPRLNRRPLTVTPRGAQTAIGESS
jgi:hypothetical protein